MAAQVHDHATALLRDLVERGVQLGPAVAPQRPEHVPGQALRVDADEHVLLAVDLAEDQGEVLLAVEHRLVDDRAEAALGDRELCKAVTGQRPRV